jgi:hypothetical protein
VLGRGLGPNVPTPEQYQGYALECLRLAERVSEPGSKAFLLEMAQAWIRLSDQLKARAEQERELPQGRVLVGYTD